jgi:hypothetical protein
MYHLLNEGLGSIVPVLIGFACMTPPPAGDKAGPPVRIRFEQGGFEGRGLTECPGGRVELKVGEKSASLYDKTTGKRIGAPLEFPGVFVPTDPPVIACWAFSPDGRLVAIGSRFIEGNKDKTNVGYIRVWDTATGALVAENPGRTGSIRRLAFTKDGRRVLLEADRHEIYGP